MPTLLSEFARFASHPARRREQIRGCQRRRCVGRYVPWPDPGLAQATGQEPELNHPRMTRPEAVKQKAQSTKPGTNFAKAPINAALTTEGKIGLLRDMLRIRRFEQAALKFYNMGKMGGFLHVYHRCRHGPPPGGQ